MNARHVVSLVTILLAGCAPTVAQEQTDGVRLNQVGFYPEAPKEAVVVGVDAGPFFVIDGASGETAYEGTLGDARAWSLSGETVRRADFSSLREIGTYRLVMPGVDTSYAFDVRPEVHRSVAQAALKGFYFIRASTALPERYAGAWARPAGHPDEEVLVHPSAATDERPAGTSIAAPRGWYDAGDYNKYVVNSGITTYTLLALYEHYPAFATALETNIPESGDDVPDVLDEALWNLRWMLAMQDPNDGGVYHKLTHAGFQGFVMPHEATAPRYVVQKSTAAALDFAAVMAQAARLYDDFPDVFPDLADSMRIAALDAWSWARSHPDVAYDQRALNRTHDPDITTGAYGDRDFEDEFAWAATELFVTTGADSFLTEGSALDLDPSVPSWPDVGGLAWYTLLEHRDRLPASIDTAAMKQRFLYFAEDLTEARDEVPYGTVMGHAERDFVWGSSGVAANQAMALLQGYRLTADTSYLHAALSNLDYLLGRNATGYSFLTGYGDRPVMNPHHRPSEADDVPEPVRGLLSGGPNPGQQDRRSCSDYPSDRPARSFLDHVCSYAANEIAINWNAPLVYTAAAIEAELAE